MLLSINILYIPDYLDINECSTDFKICSNLTNSYCFNNNGNYECKCNTGYEKINDICEGYNITQLYKHSIVIMVKLEFMYVNILNN